MTTLETRPSYASGPQYCPDDEWQRRFIGRTFHALIRGTAVTLLMPIEALEHLRWSRSIRWQTMLFWTLSVVFYICGAVIWMGRAVPAGRHPALPSVLCWAGMLLIAVANDKLRSRERTRWHADQHCRAYHHRSHWHHRHHDRRRWQTAFSAERENVSASGRTRPAGVCCGNCRECKEEICLKTGLPKKKSTATGTGVAGSGIRTA